ncbi:hypothetical protein E2C01_029335 [Portunus trituberculatus]|uniref:Uncharacterized protein n=1 Tax=Portunus trituberculatus TaxID=210409 RepID=A0A5B7ERL7_PORTR|nr:hypothetical protein [Portunus trituberculatus]
MERRPPPIPAPPLVRRDSRGKRRSCGSGGSHILQHCHRRSGPREVTLFASCWALPRHFRLTTHLWHPVSSSGTSSALRAYTMTLRPRRHPGDGGCPPPIPLGLGANKRRGQY